MKIAQRILTEATQKEALKAIKGLPRKIMTSDLEAIAKKSGIDVKELKQAHIVKFGRLDLKNLK